MSVWLLTSILPCVYSLIQPPATQEILPSFPHHLVDKRTHNNDLLDSRYTEKVREGLAQRIESLGVDSEGAAVIRRAFVIVPELPGYVQTPSVPTLHVCIFIIAP